MIRNWFWSVFVPYKVKRFYYAGGIENDYLRAGTPIGRGRSQSMFNLCTKREQAFIVWRDPIFKEYLTGEVK